MATFTYTGANITASAGTTGSGLAVGQTSPSLITPAIGVATGTSLALTSVAGGPLILSSTSATGTPYIQFNKDTSTLIGYVQGGINSTGLASGSGMGMLATGTNPIYLIIGSTNILNATIATSVFSNQVQATSFSPSTTSGIIGTTTNNNAAAGSVGEVVSSQIASGSAVSLTSGITSNVTSISLTAGDWDIYGNVSFVVDPLVTNIADAVGWINTVTATFPDISLRSSIVYGSAGIVVNTHPSFCVPSLRVSLSGTTTYYLSAYADFSVSTLAACGQIFARRRR
ncbi:MAG: hypothetical protein AB7F29_13775 [Candidatus Nitrosocosmicus sp.]